MNADFETLFLQARELPAPEERAAFLDKACAGDADLRRRLEEMLVNADEAVEFFGDAVTRLASRGPVIEMSGEKTGGMVGAYKLLQQIGEGGFGTVWMADQLRPVRRRVALKVIKPGLDTKEVIARFEQERQALALMDHPNIARVFDAGATESGRPYFVMELVRGTRITDYCDENGVTISERVHLFIQVCQAVHHAHQKGIIHRDIKPSNVLVTIHDGEPVVKVIDFGVAKATQGSLTEATLFTQFHQMIGTPAYMSPEQAEMTSQDIDTRSDIYSLGVLLYELITGRTPLDATTMAKGGLDEMRRLIREVTPPRPSARVKTLSAEELTTTAKRRRTESGKLTTTLRGDLDWIAMMCLEKDRKRRYDSAHALAIDLQRYLAHGIVTARPPTASYLMGRIIRRHRFIFGAAAAVLVTLAGGIATTIWMALRAADERDNAKRAEGKSEERRQDAVVEKQRAVEQTAVKERVLTFLVQDLLLQADSSEQQKLSETAKPDLTVKEALTRAASRIGDRFQDRPAEEAAIRSAIGRAYQGIGEPLLAEPQLERSLAVLKKLPAPSTGEILLAMASLMEARNSSGHFKESVSLGEEILKLAATVETPDSAFLLTIRTHLAQALSNGGDLTKGLALQEEVVRAHSAKGGAKTREAIRARLNLARAYVSNGKYSEALADFDEVLTWQRNNLSKDDLELASTLFGLGTTYGSLNQPDKALPLYVEARDILEKVQQPNHEQILQVMEGLARTYEQLGQRDQHLEMVQKVATGMQATHGADHLLTLRAKARLGASHFDSGDRDKGLKLLEEAKARQEEVLGRTHQDTLASMTLLGRLYWSAGRGDDAIKVFADARTRSIEALGKNNPLTGRITLNLGVNYIEKDRLAEGIDLVAEALTTQKAPDGTPDPAILGAIRAHVTAHENQKHYEAAVALQRLLVDTLRKHPQTDPRETATETSRLGGDLLKLEKFEDARTQLQQALDIFTEKAPDNWRRHVTQLFLSGALAGLKQFTQAEPMMLEASERLQTETGVNATYKRDALSRLANLYEAWDQADPDPARREKAAEWKKKLAEFK